MMSHCSKKAIYRYVFLVFFLYACSNHKPLPEEETIHAYSLNNNNDVSFSDSAPVFFVFGYDQPHNRIGTPTYIKNKHGHTSLLINTENPVYYYLNQTFHTEKDHYTNDVYRIHFPKIPYRLIPFHFSAGKNPGLMILITRNSKKQPVLITTVHTCGCYISITPTSYLDKLSYPDHYTYEPVLNHGETLPFILDYSGYKKPQLTISLRPDVHRVTNIALIEKHQVSRQNGYRLIDSEVQPIQTLEELITEDGSESFYYESGVMEGHVKGAVKPWETLILGIFVLDLFVGTDKIYSGDPESGKVFYTSLKPWNRNHSDMRNFPEFLKFWGWNL